MTKPVITETIFADDPTKVTGSFRLFAQDGGGGVAYTNAGTPVTLGGIIRISFDAAGVLKADDGLTDLTLNPNSGSSDDAIINPTGTVWEYEIKYPTVRTSDIRYITIPDGVGPYDVSDILTFQPDAIIPAGVLPITGGTMTGALVIDANDGLRIPKIGDPTRYIIEFLRTLSDSAAVITFRDPGPVTPGANGTFWQVLDSTSPGSQITGINRDGGQFWTDGLSFLRGAAIHANTAYWPQIRFCFLDQPNKRAPALVFDYIGAGGSTVTNLTDTITVDAGKETWIRHTDDDFIQNSKATRFGTSSIVTVGPAGPGSEPGVSMSNNLGTGTVFVYRRTANVLRLTATTTEVTGVLEVADTAAGVPGIAGLTTTTAGVRWDATLGFVLITSSTDRWRVGGTGNFVPASDNAYDIGATTAFVKSLFTHAIDLGSSGLYSSNGTPEGVTTGKPGSINEDYTNGAAYVKATGTGNTGWVPIATGTTIAQTFPYRRMRSGTYTVPGGNTTTGTPAANTAVAIPFKPDTSVTLTRIGVNVTGTTATATARLGIYNDDGTGYPGTVLNDAGTVATATSGWKEITISQAVTAGTVYWLVYAAQTAAATITVINAGDWAPNVATSASLSSTDTGYSMTGVSGSFGTWSATLAEFANSPRIAVKV